MSIEEKVNFAVEKFLNEEGTLTEIMSLVNLHSTKPISNRLEELGYHMYNGAKASQVKALKLAVEEYLSNTDNPSLTQIASKYKISRTTLSNRLKSLGYTVINHQNKLKFNENVFDSIDTEEKAYWLGFIYADGYIDSTPLNPDKKSRYQFELSLKGDDYGHLEKFNIFMGHSRNNIKLQDTKCEGVICKRCRWDIVNKHLWETLNSYGCTPRKSLTLTFPNKLIFVESDKYSKEDLIKHFIRGYWDGDGCLSWKNKEHTSPDISVLGTEDFLTEIKHNLPLEFDYVLNDTGKSGKTKCLRICGKNAYNLAKFLYANATIYLDRKYQKYLEYCRLYEKSDRKLQTKIGGGCDANPEVITETKESVTP